MLFPPKRTAFALFAACLLASCTFDPQLSGPFAGDTGDASAPIDDGGKPGGDVARNNGGGGDGGGGSPDVARPDTGGPIDLGTADDGPPPTDFGADDFGVDLTAPADMGGGTIICGGRPIDPMTSPQHCGGCNNACDPRHGTCSNGACLCAAGATPCGRDNTCRVTAFDPNNCGMCGNACDPGEFCVQGSCVCRTGLTDCNGRCVDRSSDPRHCGTCGNNCGGKVCLDGACENRNACPLGVSSCDTQGGTACLREDDGDLHCGSGLQDACGDVCQQDEFCYDSSVIARPECVTYRPGVGCASCPCADCRDGEICLTTNSVSGVAYCVSR